MKTGLSYTSKTIVAEQQLALSVGSGDLPVFATPSMVALMENAAMNAVKAELPEGSTTVGAAISIDHTRPSAQGAEISATAVLTAVEGRKLTFEVSAEDAAGPIGRGTHVRYVVDRERFLAKL